MYPNMFWENNVIRNQKIACPDDAKINFAKVQ